MQKPEGFIDKLKMLPKLAEISSAFPKTVSNGPCKEVIRREDFSLDEFPDSALLAGRRRPLHHAADGVLAQSGNRQAQLRHVPHAGVRRPDHRHALAETQAGRRALPAARRGRANRPACPSRSRSAPIPATMYSAILPLPPEIDEMLFAGFLRGKAGRDGEVRNLRSRSAGELPRSCSKAMWNLGETAPRRAVRRPHRLLFARRRLSGLSHRMHHASQEARSTPPPSSGRRRWKISTWARRSSEFSCR